MGSSSYVDGELWLTDRKYTLEQAELLHDMVAVDGNEPMLQFHDLLLEGNDRVIQFPAGTKVEVDAQLHNTYLDELEEKLIEIVVGWISYKNDWEMWEPPTYLVFYPDGTTEHFEPKVEYPGLDEALESFR